MKNVSELSVQAIENDCHVQKCGLYKSKVPLTFISGGE